ncbi:MAG: hypothetical protein HYT87_12805 [Nitrospirae bacterium]|nr:hypothetical protein [Nitrospirota bacterium]
MRKYELSVSEDRYGDQHCIGLVIRNRVNHQLVVISGSRRKRGDLWISVSASPASLLAVKTASSLETSKNGYEEGMCRFEFRGTVDPRAKKFRHAVLFVARKLLGLEGVQPSVRSGRMVTAEPALRAA